MHNLLQKSFSSALTRFYRTKLKRKLCKSHNILEGMCQAAFCMQLRATFMQQRETLERLVIVQRRFSQATLLANLTFSSLLFFYHFLSSATFCELSKTQSFLQKETSAESTATKLHLPMKPKISHLWIGFRLCSKKYLTYWTRCSFPKIALTEHQLV